MSDPGRTWILTLPWAEAALVAEFTVPGEPESKSRPRFAKRGGRTYAYTPQKTKDAENVLGTLFRQAAKGRHILEDKSLYAITAVFHCGTAQRRDVDNMFKLICDALNGIAYVDDSQVVALSGYKDRVDKGEARSEVKIFRVGYKESLVVNCEQCGAEFSLYDSWAGRRFCSQACHLKWRADRRERICDNCGSIFTHRHPGSQAQFCSIACKNDYANVLVACLHCGTEFLRPRCLVNKGHHLCSSECKRLFHNAQRKSAAKGTCQDCGGPTSKKTYKRCAGCAVVAGGKWADRTSKEAS